MTCHFRDKKMKNFFSSFFFSVKILLRDSILDSHRYHSYITFLPVRELVLFCMHSTMTRTKHSGVRHESRKMKQVSLFDRNGNDILIIWCGLKTKWTDVFLFALPNGPFGMGHFISRIILYTIFNTICSFWIQLSMQSVSISETKCNQFQSVAFWMAFYGLSHFYLSMNNVEKSQITFI